MFPPSPAVTITMPHALAASTLPAVLELPAHPHADSDDDEESPDDEIEDPEAWPERNEADDDRDAVRGELLISSPFSEKFSLWLLLLLVDPSSRFDAELFVLDHVGRSGDSSQLTPPLGHGTATSTSLQ